MSELIKPCTLAIPKTEVDQLHRKLDDNPSPIARCRPKRRQGLWLRDAMGRESIHSLDEQLLMAESRGAHQFDTPIHNLNRRHNRPLRPPTFSKPQRHTHPSCPRLASEIMPLLSNPDDPKDQAFHCIAPSLPGFCFSDTPSHRGWNMKDTARIFHTLMFRLGYNQYCVQAGDWGQFVARELGANPAYAGACKVVHLNYCPGNLPSELSDSELTEREIACRAKGIDWRTSHVGYAVLMRTRPHTVGWMLQDNPVGLLAFVGEKYEEAANPEMQKYQKWTDHILTTVCLYYFSNCIMTSTLPYFENIRHDEFAEYAMQDENLIKCPFGYTSCWFDTAPNSKRAVERTGNLVFYKKRDDTGHFACLEDPEGIAEDVREVVSAHLSRS
ncbi:hypothetical protein LTR27_008231 [Elasticomyces elasticus]|nr:hypothetical protein LTR27_008231 [Elasticomyces elasticus]